MNATRYAFHLLMLALPLSTLLIAHLVEILVFLRTLSDQLPEVLEATAGTRSVLAVRNWSWCCVGNKANEISWSITIDSAAFATHQLHADVAEEGNQISHAPGSCPLW